MFLFFCSSWLTASLTAESACYKLSMGVAVPVTYALLSPSPPPRLPPPVAVASLPPLKELRYGVPYVDDAVAPAPTLPIESSANPPSKRGWLHGKDAIRHYHSQTTEESKPKAIYVDHSGKAITTWEFLSMGEYSLVVHTYE